MERNRVTSVWNEITISGEGVGITLYSEGETGAIVEDETWFTFDELQSEMRGEIVNLSLSDNARDTLSEMSRLADIGRIFEDGHHGEQSRIGQPKKSAYDLPEEGDVMNDPESNVQFGDGRVKVTKVTSKESKNWTLVVNGKETTVAQQNPGHPSNAPVILGNYIEGSDKSYAYPVTRLEETEPAGPDQFKPSDS